jgi:hypothetical protein
MSQSSLLKNEPLTHKMHLKKSRLRCHLKLSSSKSGGKVVVLHLLPDWKPPIASYCRSAEWAHESRCAFQLFIVFRTSAMFHYLKRKGFTFHYLKRKGSELSRRVRTAEIVYRSVCVMDWWMVYSLCAPESKNNFQGTQSLLDDYSVIKLG